VDESATLGAPCFPNPFALLLGFAFSAVNVNVIASCGDKRNDENGWWRRRLGLDQEKAVQAELLLLANKRIRANCTITSTDGDGDGDGDFCDFMAPHWTIMLDRQTPTSLSYRFDSDCFKLGK
jgi:hypothetical protein